MTSKEEPSGGQIDRTSAAATSRAVSMHMQHPYIPELQALNRMKPTSTAATGGSLHPFCPGMLFVWFAILGMPPARSCQHVMLPAVRRRQTCH